VFDEERRWVLGGGCRWWAQARRAGSDVELANQFGSGSDVELLLDFLTFCEESGLRLTEVGSDRHPRAAIGT
jgi:hypothetical protein